MFLVFRKHTVECSKNGIIVTLYVDNDDIEFAKELTNISTNDDTNDISVSARDYLKKHLPDLKVSLIKIFVGTLMIATINMADDKQVGATENITPITINQKAINNSSDISVLLDNKLLSFPQQPFILNGVTYVPIREISEAIGATVSWEQNTKAITISRDNNEIKFMVGSDKAVIDNKIVSMPKSYLVNQKTMLPVRFLSEEMGLTVQWDNELRLVIVSTTGQTQTTEELKRILTIEGKKEILTYTEEDLYWLSRIVNAEAQGESFDAKLAVANVIINRTQSKEYPNTIKDVIFDTNFGVQFQPITNGSIYDTPLDESIKAAEEALKGVNNAPGVLFFLNPRIVGMSWIIENRTFAFQLENHNFYY